MAITTFDERSLAPSAPDRPGLVARLRDRLFAARQEMADREIAEQLLALDDETLRANGYIRTVLRRRVGRG